MHFFGELGVQTTFNSCPTTVRGNKSLVSSKYGSVRSTTTNGPGWDCRREILGSREVLEHAFSMGFCMKLV